MRHFVLLLDRCTRIKSVIDLSTLQWTTLTHHRSQASVDRGVLDLSFVVVVGRHHHGARTAAPLSAPELGPGQPNVTEIFQQGRLGLDVPRDMLSTVHEENQVVPGQRRCTDTLLSLAHRSRLLMLLLRADIGVLIRCCWCELSSSSACH